MPTRKSIFETNSSSTHSLVSFGKTDYVKVDEEEEKIELYEGALDNDELETDGSDRKDWRTSAEFLHSWARRCGKPSDMEMLKKVIEDYTKKEVVFKEGMVYSDCSFEKTKYEEESPEKEKNAERMRLKELALDLGWAFKDEKTLKDAIFLDMRTTCAYGHD